MSDLNLTRRHLFCTAAAVAIVPSMPAYGIPAPPPQGCDGLRCAEIDWEIVNPSYAAELREDRRAIEEADFAEVFGETLQDFFGAAP